MSAVASGRPLQAILTAFDAGATTLIDIRRRTGLDDDVVRAGVDHLVRTGRVQTQLLSAGCPAGGCGACAARCADQIPAPVGGGPRRVLLQLRPPQRD